jgi:YidC/Oxa1 family membrane protein insertase
VAEVWNGLLSGLGAMLAFFYQLIPSYGVAIILLTVAVRIVLIPLTIKQTRSMHAMQRLQPKIKELQRKHKGNRQKLNQELMKLYQEHQVNPLGGCLPLLLQLPVFFALYQVLTRAGAGGVPGTGFLPEGSRLATAIMTGQANFLGMNLACSPTRAGQGEVVLFEGGPELFCGAGAWIRVPFYLLVALMVFTTYYQQRQMQRATSAAGQQQQPQMQMMTRIMPIFLGVISINIAAGVLVYWVTTNAWQIGQQYLMLRSRVQEPAAPGGDGKPGGRGKDPAKPPAKPPTGGRPSKKSGGKSGDGGGDGAKGSGGRNARGRKKRSKR